MMRLGLLGITLLIIVGCVTCGGGEMSIKDKYEQMLYTTVRIDTGNGGGSGVVIDTHGGYTMILTAKHVIRDKDKVRVRFYPKEAEYPAQITKVSEEYDLAILMVKHTHKYVANRDEPFELLVFQETFKLGASLGRDWPQATVGIVSSVDNYFFTTSSPVIWGDSGGGIFIEDGDEFVLVGVAVNIAVAHGYPVFHMGGAVDMFAVEDFLKE